MARILVTGARGFIGSHLLGELARAKHDVHGIDRSEGDLRVAGVFEEQMSEYNPEIVVHLAAKVGRQFGEDDLDATIRDNALMTALVARSCSAHRARLVYASTSEVYGDQGNDVCEECVSDNRGRVHNLYGLSKRWGEEVAHLYAPDGLTILRLSMPYGPGLPWGTGRAAIINMLWQAHTGQTIPVHRGAVRSWCWVGDTVRGIRYTIERAEDGVFNVGRDDALTSMLEVAELACDIAGGNHDLIQEIEAPHNQTVVKNLSTSRLRSLGWEPAVDLEAGMERTYDWILSCL